MYTGLPGVTLDVVVIIMSINVRITKPYEPLDGPDDRQSLTNAANFHYAKIPVMAKTPRQVDPRGTGSNRLNRVTQQGMQDFSEKYGGNPYEQRTHANDAQHDMRLKQLAKSMPEYLMELQRVQEHAKNTGIAISQGASDELEAIKRQGAAMMDETMDEIARPGL